MPNKNVKKEKMDIITKMSVIGIVGLLTILIVFGLISCSKKDTNKTDHTPDVSTGDDSEDTPKEFERILGVVKNVDIVSKQLYVYDIENNELIVLEIDGGVGIKDEYGTELTFAQLQLGDMVESKYDKNKMRPEYVNKTAKTWERKNVKDVIINTSEKKIEIGNDIYDYTDELIAIYNGTSFDISNINDVDEVTLRGYKNTVWAVMMQNRHGFITLKNHSSYIGGVMEVGTKTLIDIEEATSVTIPVGVHKILITKEGMTNYSAEIMIEEDKEFIIDLGDSTPKVGLVNFILSEEDIKVYLNDELVNTGEPIKLNFGKYTLRAEKEGFVKVEDEVTINQAYIDYQISLEIEPMFVHINSPQGVELYIDYNYVGIIPISTPITAGEHTVTLRKDSFYSKSYPITIEENGKDSFLTFPDLIPINGDNNDNSNNNNDNNNNNNNDNTNSDNTGTDPNDNQDDENDDNEKPTPGEDTYNN